MASSPSTPPNTDEAQAIHAPNAPSNSSNKRPLSPTASVSRPKVQKTLQSDVLNLSVKYGWTPSQRLKDALRSIGMIEVHKTVVRERITLFLPYIQHHNFIWRNDYLWLGWTDYYDYTLPLYYKPSPEKTWETSCFFDFSSDSTPRDDVFGKIRYYPSIGYLFEDVIHEHGGDNAAMNEYLQALWWVVRMFVCQRADNEDNHVQQFGTGWKYPFWRYELEHRADNVNVGYIETQLKHQPQVTTDDILIANEFDIQLHAPWEDDNLSQSDEAPTIPAEPDTQDLMDVDPQDSHEATQPTIGEPAPINNLPQTDTNTTKHVRARNGGRADLQMEPLNITTVSLKPIVWRYEPK